MSDEQGRITPWYAAGTDIDNRKMAEQRLLEENVSETRYPTPFLDQSAALPPSCGLDSAQEIGASIQPKRSNRSHVDRIRACSNIPELAKQTASKRLTKPRNWR